MDASGFDDREPVRERPLRPPMALGDAEAFAAAAGTPPDVRLRACEELVQHGMTARALPALRELQALPRLATPVRRLVAIARYVERAVRWLDFTGSTPGEGRWQTLDGSAAPGPSSEPSGALLWVRGGAAKTVLVFSTLAGGFGPMRGWNSVFLVHRFLRRLPVNIVYLRDETWCLNLAGNRSFGADYGACVAGIRGLCEERGWAEVHALGLSNGGYAALRFGLDLGLRAVLSFSGPTNLESAEDRTRLGMQGLYAAAPGMTADLLPLFQRSERRPRMLLCYGEGNAFDTVMAQRMNVFPETELIAFRDFDGHSTFMEAGRLDQLGDLAARLLELPR